MNLGQTYKIKIINYDSALGIGFSATKKAKLIFEGKHFYTFEYQSKSGEMVRTTISKFDFKKNPGLIQEA